MNAIKALCGITLSKKSMSVIIPASTGTCTAYILIQGRNSRSLALLFRIPVANIKFKYIFFPKMNGSENKFEYILSPQ